MSSERNYSGVAAQRHRKIVIYRHLLIEWTNCAGAGEVSELHGALRQIVAVVCMLGTIRGRDAGMMC